MDIRKQLEQAEGKKTHAYQDNLGFWTIGIGRLIDPKKAPLGGLSEDEIQYLLSNDIKKAKAECLDLFPAFNMFSQDRQNALIDLMFNLGYEKISTYHTFLGQVNNMDWAAVQNNLKGWTLWRSQVGVRADRVIAQFGG